MAFYRDATDGWWGTDYGSLPDWKGKNERHNPSIHMTAYFAALHTPQVMVMFTDIPGPHSPPADSANPKPPNDFVSRQF